ncbi:MAG: [LysW]-aminoadipate kinase [Anaerolineaceae bacterium]|nr:[LysW]-aminoadipate kinase [Anaerolineaceae bacterium]
MPANLLVVKLGGAEGVDLSSTCEDLVHVLRRDRRPLVLVHGASAEANRLCEEAGLPLRTLTSPSGHSSRYTDAPTRDLFVQAAETVNREILACLGHNGVEAAGLTGDNIVLQARRKQALRAQVEGRVRIIRDDYSGTITAVDGQALLALLKAGRIPVLPPLADSSDGLLNIDGDRAAAAVASALGADDLVILSNVRGLYRDFPDEDSIVPVISPGNREQALAWARGRMKRKVLAATEALDGGAGRVIVSDGRVREPLQNALAGAGSVFES